MEIIDDSHGGTDIKNESLLSTTRASIKQNADEYNMARDEYYEVQERPSNGAGEGAEKSGSSEG
jgi:hypothetical protein